MDSIKVFTRILRRQHFWFLSVLVALASLVVWYLSVGSLASDQESFLSDISSSYSAVSTVATTPNHQNQQIQDSMKQLLAQRRKEVLDAWREKYEQQRSGGILKWPEELGDAFMARVTEERFVPIERFPFEAVGPDVAIDTFMRENYRDHVKRELPKLAGVIGAQWTPSLDGTGMSRRMIFDEDESGRGGPVDTSVVLWNRLDQERIQTEHFDWSIGAPPSSWEVLYTQEDLWVLRALMEIIKRTNGDATVRHNAAIKEIEFIKIGKSAVAGGGRIWREAGTAAGEEGSEYVEPEGPALPLEDERGSGDMMQRIRVDPADGRYVDDNYQALSGDQLRALLDSDAPQDAYLRVAKRMPVRMRVKIDQRAITRLLVECANSNLTLEVRQFRLNPIDTVGRQTGISPFSLSAGGEYGGIFDGGGGIGVGRDFEPDLVGRGGGGFGGLPVQAFPYDVKAEIYGLIYIYNEPDTKILGGEEGEFLEEGGGSAPEDGSDRSLATNP